MKLITFLLFLCLVFSPGVKPLAQGSSNYVLHTIKQGESLYSISNMYDVGKEEIVRMNPGCEKKIYAGNTLKIPQDYVQAPSSVNNDVFHTVQEGETFYRLSVMYQVSLKEIMEANPEISAESLKVGDVVRIPSSKMLLQETTAISRAATTTTTTTTKKTETYNLPVSTRAILNEIDREIDQEIQKSLILKVAVILPSPTKKVTESVRRNRFYEGFQAAIDSLKRQNITVELSVYNVGNDASSINTILAKSELRQANIIYAPLNEMYIKPLITFSNDQKIPLVIPYATEDIDLSWNPNTYLVKAPPHYLYQGVYNCFLRKFPNPNVILLDGLSTDKDKASFISGLKNELINNGAPVQTINSILTTDILKSTLRLDKENVFVLTSGSNAALTKSIAHLKKVIKDNPDFRISVFGYPEWQNYTGNNMIENLFEINAYIYSSHYNKSLNLTQNPATAFLKWYQRRLLSIYPSDKTMGFETSYFFLKGLFDYGTELNNNIQNIDTELIKNGFKFEQINNGGGYVNRDIFFINYAKDLMLNKVVFK
ncbi:LysM peptidoglycan-binding domain-containing protein [Bacteroides sp. 224]|uniref:LysM peptidoglycan-binding domain-containing protein n=1 Tax=Bacteroides sp. 224 TaxID=2302936 RepID=UPI0013D1F829|nr:LysM peptidoglycan-binding domain-containing protein [Bacteroides sp. 224]NDV66002.1 LysM peptidoglycan-binding domain-containing protein [Bacteroides sp. 224]